MMIIPADFDDLRLKALLHLHLGGMHASSPPGSVYALDLSGLKAPSISFYAAWEGETLLAMGALKELDALSGEIKSMRTDPAHLRRGIATAMLDHLLAVAKSRGYRRVSLETGSGPAFEPALALYRRRGFLDGSPFGDYVPTEFNQFLHLDLA
ncbi:MULTISPECIES: GNAT family N-acetyltransferase [Rhodomicrobium]|uniref:GNAT family N-acetyltransferase n=1 Tax=Rhodomicrobium TaxID=1068 RepID=UPI000B4B79C6|nr:MULTISPECIES: GNAT family N-acetyltransferase [Rhodomicrobium]